ncbi:unnamed protein product [Symbiodinium sp. CCMP2456]|nr:unnamed protein product [Symbiodinium sp. CCMP2456]
MGYPQDLVHYDVRRKYELANNFSIELSHFRRSSDVVPSPVPTSPGKANHMAIFTWALVRKIQDPETPSSSFVDVLNREWVISFFAAIGFHDRNAIDQWMQLGFAVTKDKTFFKKQNNEKMFAIPLSISTTYLRGEVVRKACDILRGYITKANDAGLKGVFPYLQLYVGQLPAALLLQLSTQLLRLRWRPREEHQEADDLTNFNFNRSDLDLRVNCSLKDLQLDLFHELAASYDAYTLAKVELKAAGRKEGPTSKKQRMLEKTNW